MPSRFFPAANPLRWLAWSAGAVAVVLSALAYYAGLFRVLRFDLVVHAVTAAALTLLLAAYMRAMLPSVWRPVSYVAVLVALAFAIGAAWEAGEWFYDVLTGGNASRGKTDTMTDLVADALGALLAAVIALAIERRHAKASGAPL
jgi:uncharacterized membrane protein YjdF